MRLLLTIALLSLPALALATPGITGVSGTFTHGATVTVSGSGFGVKSPVAPLLWDPVDGMYSSTTAGTTVPTGGSNPWNSSGGSGMYDPKFISAPRGKYSAKYTNAGSPSSVGNAVLGEKSWSACAGAKLYLSYWMYPHQDLGNPGNSNKLFRLTDDGGWSGSVSTVIWDTGTNYLFTYSVANGYTGQQHPTNTYGNDGAWNRMEVLVDNSVSPKPAVTAWVNRTQGASFQSGSSIANIIGIYTLGADWTNTQNSPIPQLDWGEIYVDSTAARVEICNSSTFAGSTHCEIQIPQTQWIDNSLQVQINQGSFPDGTTAYMYVIDAGGTASANQPVTFGSSGGGGTNGSCGSVSGGTTSTAPTTNLCGDSSTPTVTLSGATYSWTCAGSGGGSDASCTSIYSATAPTPTIVRTKPAGGRAIFGTGGRRNEYVLGFTASAPSPPACTAQQDLGTPVNDDNSFASGSTKTWIAHSFTTGSTGYTLTQLGLDLFKSVGSPTQTLTVYIYSDASGTAPGSALATATSTISASSLPSTSGTAVQLVGFSGLTLAPSTKYWVVVKASATNGSNYPGFAARSVAGGAAGTTGRMVFSSDGSSWSDLNGYGDTLQGRVKTYSGTCP